MMQPAFLARLLPHLARSALFAFFAFWAIPGQTQSPDRERAQMLQMQQQLQRLQSDNAALLREKTQLQDQAKDAERLKKESTQTVKELAQSHAQAAAQAREAKALRAELESLRAQSTTQLDQWKKALTERDDALQFAAQEKRRIESANALLEVRLRLQTERSDVCEMKHAQALRFANRMVDKYAQGRMRLCDPIMALWKVHDQDEIQALHDEIYEFRLDVPAATPANAAAIAPPAGTPTAATAPGVSAPASLVPAPTPPAAGAPAQPALAPAAPAAKN